MNLYRKTRSKLLNICTSYFKRLLFHNKREAGTTEYFVLNFSFFFLWRCDPTRAMASSFLRFLDHTQRRIAVGRTPLDAWSARRRDLYLTTHNTHNRQTSMPSVGFEPTISADERWQTYALDRAATGTGFEVRIGVENGFWGAVCFTSELILSCYNDFVSCL